MVILNRCGTAERLAGEGGRQAAARGVREATRCDQRGQESDGGSEKGRELYFPGFSISAHPQPSAEVAANLCANAEEAKRAVLKAQGELSTARQLARGRCDCE